jgi:mycothiol synthase
VPVRSLTVTTFGSVSPAVGDAELAPAPADSALTWRPLTRGDVPAWFRLIAAAEEVDRTGEHYDADDLAEELADPGLDLARDTIALVLPDGQLAGYGIVRAPRVVRDIDRINLEGAVHPTHRRRGLGRQLLGWLERRADQIHRARQPQLPGAYRVNPFARTADHIALLERAGYAPVRWWNVMSRDLSEPPPQPGPVPAGLRLIPYDGAHDDAVRRAHNEAFDEHWGSSEHDRDEWRQWFTGHRAFEPASSFLVLDGEEIAAYVLSYFWAAGAAATGVREGYVGQLGTRAAWRKRGLASALLAHALAAFHAAGYHRAGLDVDTDNASGALGLYQRHGFAVDVRRVTYLRPIS